jgi:type I restriction enzyme S subunit
VTTTKLGAVTSKVGSGATPRGGTNVYQSAGVAFIRSQNVLDNRMKLDDVARISDAAARALRSVEVQAGDVLINITGDSIARCCVVDQGILPARVSQHVAIVRTNDYMDSRFLQRALVNRPMKANLLNISSGGTRNALTKAMIEDLDIPMPLLDEQRAIADVLGALDDKIAANERVAEIAFELAQSLVRSVLNSQDSLVESKFRALGQLSDGPHATPTRRSDGPHFLNISSLKSGRLDLAESDHVSEEDFAKWTCRVTPQKGDLLFSYETRIGEAALMPGGLRACLGRRMALLRPDRTVMDPVFLLHFYLSPAFQRIVAMHTIHGATVPRLGLATMPDWVIEIPSFEAQQQIAGALGSLQESIVQAEREGDCLARTRDELLPLLMSGKVRVKNETAVSEVI